MAGGLREGNVVNRVAIAFLTKDRVEKTKQTVEPLLQPDKFDTYQIDGSVTQEGIDLTYELMKIEKLYLHPDVKGGTCRAIAYSLTHLLTMGYDYIGFCESDVLLDPDWFEPTMALFDNTEGLEVGAASPRCYVDRILAQRDGYALMHNLGAGVVIFTRRAAEIVLERYRTGWTTENRRVFAALSGIDIGSYWAFRRSEHMLVADWGFDRELALHGLASVALTPSKATMLEDIAAQGLEMAPADTSQRRSDKAFNQFSLMTAALRGGALVLPDQASPHLRLGDGSHIVFAHQLSGIGGHYTGDWRYRWSVAFGGHAWESGKQPAEFEVPVLGGCSLFIVSCGRSGKIDVKDECGARGEFDLPVAQQLTVPPYAVEIWEVPVRPRCFSQGVVHVQALTPGIVFYGLRTTEPQPYLPDRFSFATLSPLEG